MKNKHFIKSIFKEYKTDFNEKLKIMEWKEKDIYYCYFFLDDELIYSDWCSVKKMLNHRIKKELKKYVLL